MRRPAVGESRELCWQSVRKDLHRTEAGQRAETGTSAGERGEEEDAPQGGCDSDDSPGDQQVDVEESADRQAKANELAEAARQLSSIKPKDWRWKRKHNGR